jgi:hypothetical protein
MSMPNTRLSGRVYVMVGWRSAGVWSCVAWVIVVLCSLPRPAGVLQVLERSPVGAHLVRDLVPSASPHLLVLTTVAPG